MSTNARCPVCRASVYFYANSNGSRVFFDFPGPDWPKHPCTDRQKVSAEFFHEMALDEARRKYTAKKPTRNGLDRDGWKLFKVIRTRSFRLEIEHVATALKFETDLVKDGLPTLSQAIWLREESNDVTLSFFDIDRFKISYHSLRKFEARAFATLKDWLPFEQWFTQLKSVS